MMTLLVQDDDGILEDDSTAASATTHPMSKFRSSKSETNAMVFGSLGERAEIAGQVRVGRRIAFHLIDVGLAKNREE